MNNPNAAAPAFPAWKKGDFALHKADGQHPDTLMIVTGRAKDYAGRPAIALRYVFPKRLPRHWGGPTGRRRVIANPSQLLDPALFGISVAAVQS